MAFYAFFIKYKRNALCGDHVTSYQRLNHFVGFSLNFQENLFAKSSSRRNFHTEKSAHSDTHYLLKGVDKFISARFMSAGGYIGRPARNSIGHFRISSKSVPGKRQFSIGTLHSYAPTRMQVGTASHNAVHSLCLY